MYLKSGFVSSFLFHITQSELAIKLMNNVMNTYGTRELSISHGSGSWLWDTEDNKYLDALSGIAVCGLGHAHPNITKAILEQSKKLIHCSNFFSTSKQDELARKLCEIAKMSEVFFCNSGAEANETAVKIARMYGKKRGLVPPNILVTNDAFHGRTYAAISASSAMKVKAGFEPLLDGFLRVPFNDLDAIKTMAKKDKNICAVFVEPIQGEGGINIPNNHYLRDLRSICSEEGWLLMLDEVQTGNGRTGNYFCFQESGVMPDVVTTSKGLGNGFPIGACLTAGFAQHILKPGSHGSTFGGNPLACAAALATINTIINENICDNAKKVGERILMNLRGSLGNISCVKSIRGKGCMIGIEMNRPCKELFSVGLRNNIIINVTSETVIRLLPPLTYTMQESDHLSEVLIKMIKEFDLEN